MATLLKDGSPVGGHGHAKRMSTHLAAALGLFCLLQLFIVAKMGGGLVLHLGVIVATGGFAIFARVLERRWDMLDRSGLSPHGLARDFRRDVARLWLISISGGLFWVPAALLFHFLFR